MKINVMGATGQLGRRVMQALLDNGASADELITSVRSPKKAHDLFGHHFTVRHGDYNEPTSLRLAFKETDILLLIPTFAPVEQRVSQHFNALQAAKDAGVKRVVFVSFMAAEPGSQFLIAPFYLYAEAKLRLSGLPWTIVRNGMYIDPVADWIPDLVEMGHLPYPVDHGKVAYISRDDLARGLAATCLAEKQQGKLYKFTGSKAISMEELAGIISEVTGQHIPFKKVSEEEFSQICRTDNVTDSMIEILLSMYRAVERREFETVTNHLEQVTGSPPKPVEKAMEKYLMQSD